MWDTNINNEIYNIFAKIYLFFNKIDEVKKILLNDNYNFIELENIIGIEKLDDIKTKITNIISKDKHDSNDLQYLLEILLIIDYRLAVKINNNKINMSKPLNTLFSDEIMLFPKYDNLIEKRSGANISFNAKFKNILPIIIHNNIKYNVLNHYIDSYESNKELIIAAIPMQNNIINKEEKYLKSLEKAIDEGANILISSEYSGNSELDDKIYDNIIKYPNIYFLFSPSYNNEGSNITKIFYKEKNLIKEAKYQKHYPFTIRGKIVEDIKYEEPTFHLFHVKGIGIFSVVICKDFFSPQTDDFIKQTQLDCIFILSMTESYSEFNSKSSDVVRHKRVVLLCNDCEICIKKNLPSPVFYSYYSKKNGVDKNEISSWIDIKCDYNCSKNYCYFFIKLKNNNKQIVLSDFNHKVG